MHMVRIEWYWEEKHGSFSVYLTNKLVAKLLGLKLQLVNGMTGVKIGEQYFILCDKDEVPSWIEYNSIQFDEDSSYWEGLSE